MENKIYAWEMTAVKEEFRLTEKQVPALKPGEALVKVSGCGVCHTDLSFWHFGVRTRHELPLTLGHEISGLVEDGPQEWLRRNVIIPAVLPCGECELCRQGRSNICRKQLMPGNDFHGGFASHIVVPARFLCPVPAKALEKYSLAQLAVIADAVSTPYQVLKRSELVAGDLALIVGVGGIGIYAAQIAKILGAVVIVLDIDDAKLNLAMQNGADASLNVKGMDIPKVKDELRGLAKITGASPYGWKIFETSGTAAGQEMAFNLITYASTLSIVGFTMDKLNLRLSNLMAFDAKIIGTWGCKPELYPEVVDLVASGDLNIEPFIQTLPMSGINEVFQNTLNHQYQKRTVLIPDFNN